ncbi:hypothetical protein AMTR_s00111p00074120, partial [Amborella trichopoda]
ATPIPSTSLYQPTICLHVPIGQRPQKSITFDHPSQSVNSHQGVPHNFEADDYEGHEFNMNPIEPSARPLSPTYNATQSPYYSDFGAHAVGSDQYECSKDEVPSIIQIMPYTQLPWSAPSGKSNSED